MSTTVTYKGNTLTTVNNETKSLLTKGTWLEDDIEITDVSSGGSSALIVDTEDSHGGTIREITTDIEVKLQNRKTVTPSSTPQVVTADSGYDGIVEVGIEGVTGIANVYQNENGVLILDSESSDWYRSTKWPPYATGWNNSTFDGLYIVYDLSLNTMTGLPLYYSLTCTLSPTSAKYTVEGGYVDSTGTFTVEDTKTVNHNATATGFLPFWDGVTQNEQFYVVRVTSTGNITRFRFADVASPIGTIYGSGAAAAGSNKTQPVVEIYGRLPNVTNLTEAFSNFFVEHINVVDVKSVTTLYAAFLNCNRLVKVEGLDTWDTSSCTSMSTMFRYCYMLEEIDGIGDLDVSAVTTMDYCFASTKIRSIDLSKWEVSTPNMASMFRNCSKLESVILPTDCTPSSISYFAYEDYSLSDIDMTKFDLESTTTMERAFGVTNRLIKADFSNQDMDSLTTIADMFYGSNFLREVDFTNCDFSKITSTNTNMFYACVNLIRLKGFVYHKSFVLNNSRLMPESSLVEVLTNLPTVQESTTITLGTVNQAKLTAEQIAIATEKGWTVA